MPRIRGLAEQIVGRWELDYLDVVDTGVGLDCVRCIRARYPEMRGYPNPRIRTRP